MVQSNPDSIGKTRGWGQERENQSGERRVRDGTGGKIYSKEKKLTKECGGG